MNPSSSDTFDLILGKIALERRLVTSAQLRESLSLKAQAAHIGLNATLADIFIQKGFADQSEIRKLKTDQQALKARVAKEEAIGALVSKMGLVSAEAIANALESARGDPEAPGIEDMLLESGAIDENGASRIRKLRAEVLGRNTRELMETLPGLPAVMNPAAKAESGSRESDSGPGESPAPSAGERLPGLGTLAEGRATGSVEGVVLGEYEIRREIGRGAMGVVYEALQRSLNRRVALKVLPPELVMSEERVRRFRKEAEAAGNLDHPGIVRVFGMGEQSGIHFFAMEYIEGRPLDSIINEGRIPLRKACKMIAQAAQALHYAHEKGVIHRDIKPANLMIRADETMRIMDFGLARYDSGGDNLTAPGAVLGTPAYMSPEQAQGDRSKIDRRTDVYSLGAVLYEILTSRPPVNISPDQNVAMIILKLLTEDVRSPRSLNPRIPVPLETVVLKALSKDRDGRYRTAAEFSDDLERFLAGDPVSARPAGAFTRLAARARKRKATVAAVALAALAAVLGPLIWLWSAAVARRESVQGRLLQARQALESGDREKAVAVATFVKNAIADRDAAMKAQRIICEALSGSDRAAHFSALARLHSMSSGGEDSRWALATMLGRLVAESDPRATALSGLIKDKFAGSSEGLTALLVWADRKYGSGDLDEARRAYEKLAGSGVGGEHASARLARLSAITPSLNLTLNVNSIAAGDVDGDGSVETVLAGAREIFIVKKRPGTEALVVASGPMCNPDQGWIGAIAAADIDEDGTCEVIAAYGKEFSTGPGALVVLSFLQSPPRVLFRHETYETRFFHGCIAVADFSGCGRPEIALGHAFYGRKTDFFRAGQDGFSLYSTWSSFGRRGLDSDVNCVATGRFGLELPQIFLALGPWNDYAIVSIEMEPGTDKFFETSRLVFGHSKFLACGDVDGDGIDEIVACKEHTSNPVLFGPGLRFGEVMAEDMLLLKFRNGKPAREAGADLVPNLPQSGVSGAAVGDLDGDGRAEIAVLVHSSEGGGVPPERLEILRFVNGEIFREEILRNEAYARFRYCAIADFDGDGRLEIAVFGSGLKILGYE